MDFGSYAARLQTWCKRPSTARATVQLPVCFAGIGGGMVIRNVTKMPLASNKRMIQAFRLN